MHMLFCHFCYKVLKNTLKNFKMHLTCSIAQVHWGKVTNFTWKFHCVTTEMLPVMFHKAFKI